MPLARTTLIATDTATSAATPNRLDRPLRAAEVATSGLRQLALDPGAAQIENWERERREEAMTAPPVDQATRRGMP